MARIIAHQEKFLGISYSEREGPASSFLFARRCDFRTDPTKLKILPRTIKSSGNTVVDLIMDGDRQSTDSYFYGDTGHIYLKDSSESWSDLRVVPDSHGNGMRYFGEDSYLYYTSDTTIGRYGPFWGTANFVDDFMGAEGGVPLNTHSLDLESSSSRYATAADSASLSITGDMSIECSVKHESIPTTAGNSMVFASKWNGSGNQRSYFFELYCLSGYFGDGSDGALTISANTTEAPIDSACTGTAAAFSLSATNASFAAGQKILIHQTRGTNAGRWERNEIVSYTAGTITLSKALDNTYTSGAQVRVLKEYTNVTINSGKVYTAKAWNGTVGGILAFLATGTVTVTGTISANGGTGATGTGTPAGGTGGGFRGGNGKTGTPPQQAYSGEGTTGASAAQYTARGNGGGGGKAIESYTASGGSGGHGTAGITGLVESQSTPAINIGGAGGSIAGTSDLTTMVFGGGGGGESTDGIAGAGGGSGGGIIFIIGVTIATITGSITANGGAGGTGKWGASGGAGGSILIKAQTATLGTNKITATGGAAGGSRGKIGGVGRIHLDYYTSYTGTTSPTLNVTQDDSLITNISYQLRFGVSANGTTPEYLAKTLDTTPTLSQWYHYAMTWDASASLVTFYLDGTSIGTATGALTACYDSTALLAVGAKFSDAGAAESFLDGLIDEVRVWNDIRTASEIYNYKEVEIATNSANLQAYYQLDNSASDSTANANNLTLVNSPVYSTDVPFLSPTARQDLDQSLDTSGQVYALTTAIDEGATHRQTFVAAKDPQKSVEVNISDTGDDGDWTLTVHDPSNKIVASKTVVHADLHTGDFEFIFDEVWRPVIGVSYHFHLTTTSTTGAPAVVTTTDASLETADFHTYYQFLVDCDFHPMEQITNKMAIGNERYLATWDSITYTPHALTLPSGYTIRCLGTWREYLVMGTTRGSSVSSYSKGRLFFWDGYSTTYSFYYDVPEGGINAIESGDPLYFVAGYSGDLMYYSGANPQKILRMPKVEGDISLEINPKALTMWRALVHIGMAENSSSTTIERGVYSYGNLYGSISPSLSFDYSLSLGTTTGADLEIGMLMPIGSSLYISWRNGSSYGVDYVNPSNAPFENADCEFLISNADKVWAEKQAHVLRGLFKSLADGDSIKLKYKIDRQDSWVEGDLEDTEGVKESRLTLPTKANRFDEIQVAVELGTTNDDSPEFYGWGLESDDLQRERRT